MTDLNHKESEQVIAVGSGSKPDRQQVIIDNPNAKFVAVEEEIKPPPPIPGQFHKIYKDHSPGDRFRASDGTFYVLDENHSLRRAVPKVKGKKKHRRRMRGW